MLLQRRACTPHAGDMSGNTYDSDGHLCPSISKEDMPSIIAAAAFCSVVLLGLSAVYIRQRLRKRAKARGGEANPRMTSMASPLLPIASAGQRWSQVDLSPDMCRSPASPPPSSPFSPISSTFHFPILSANGRLLPPVPASRHPTSPIDPITPRPLPSPPVSSVMTDRDWEAPVVGLYPGIDLRHDLRAISPREHAFRPSPPQSAIYHRSFSAEGEDLALCDVYLEGSDGL